MLLHDISLQLGYKKDRTMKKKMLLSRVHYTVPLKKKKLIMVAWRNHSGYFVYFVEDHASSISD